LQTDASAAARAFFAIPDPFFLLERKEDKSRPEQSKKLKTKPMQKPNSSIAAHSDRHTITMLGNGRVLVATSVTMATY